MKGANHPDRLLCPRVQVVFGHEQTDVVNGLEDLSTDSESLRPGCYVRRSAAFFALAVPPVVLAPYEFVGRSYEGEDSAAAFTPLCRTPLELVAQKRTDERSRHCDEGCKHLVHVTS